MKGIISKCSLGLTLFICLSYSVAEDDLPMIGDSSSSVISIASEYNLGRLYMAQLRRTIPEYIDPVTQD